jgi:hypothetical protein
LAGIKEEAQEKQIPKKPENMKTILIFLADIMQQMVNALYVVQRY